MPKLCLGILHREAPASGKAVPKLKLGNQTSEKYSLAKLDELLICTYIVHMDTINFSWDENKDLKNQQKHKVSFDEARTVFLDENALRFFDPDHSEDEDRFLMLGMSFRLRVLIVCHCYREDDSVIRIISARKADKHEQADYLEMSNERTL